MLKRVAVASLALVGCAALSSSALAAETGVVGCLHLQKQVAQALDANQQSPNYSDASELRRAAQEFCQAGLYNQGLARYARALQLLNGQASAQDAPAAR